MPALTNMMDMLGLKKLFEKAESGDSEAKRVVRNLNQMPSVTGQAFAAPAESAMPGLATSMTLMGGRSGGSLAATPSARTPSGGGGVEVEEQEPKKKRDWGNIADRLAVMLTDIGQGWNPRTASPGDPAAASRERLRAGQMDQLKRRHDMWDRTQKMAEALPAEALTDPKFATLAQAKAAFDKDLQDGKIDNEKSASGFLTELARFRPDLEQLELQKGIQQQVGLETGLQRGRETAGLTEAKDYGFEGVTGLTGTQYLGLANQRKQQEAAAAERAIDNARMRAQLEELSRSRKMAEEDRDLGRDRLERGSTLKGVQELIESDMKRGLQPDPMNPGKLEQPTEAHLLKAVMQNKDAILAAGQRMGLEMQEPNYVTKTPGVYTIQGKQFSQEELPSMLMFIYRMMHTR